MTYLCVADTKIRAHTHMHA